MKEKKKEWDKKLLVFGVAVLVLVISFLAYGTITKMTGHAGLWNSPGDDCTPTTEVCNGVDDDCDNLIDEGGICEPQCTPTTEVCNGVDDDCDNLIDEGNVCDKAGDEGGVWYVNNQNSNCNDNGDGSMAEPLCTIEAANQRHQGGDTINIMPGVYRDGIYPKSGTASAYTVFQGVGAREQVIVLGSEEVTGWQATSNPNVFKATVPQVHPGKQMRRNAVVNGTLPGFIEMGYETVWVNDTDCYENRITRYKRADLVSCSNGGQTHDYSKNPLNAITGPGQMFFDPYTFDVYVWTYNGQNPNDLLIECSVRPLSEMAFGVPAEYCFTIWACYV